MADGRWQIVKCIENRELKVGYWLLTCIGQAEFRDTRATNIVSNCWLEGWAFVAPIFSL
jgi:hypothetical protein